MASYVPDFEITTSIGPDGTPSASVKSGMLSRFFEPRHVRKMAEAKAYEHSVMSLNDRLEAMIKSGDPEAYRLIAEFGGRTNLKNLANALQKWSLISSSKGDHEQVSDDFFSQWKDNVQLRSDEGIQTIFARLLDGEISNPGTYSLKTMDVLGHMTSDDAREFSKLRAVCVWQRNGNKDNPFTGFGKPELVIDVRRNGIGPGLVSNDYYDWCKALNIPVGYNITSHLSYLGLLERPGSDLIVPPYSNASFYIGDNLNDVVHVRNLSVDIYLLNSGTATLSITGQDLISLCEPQPAPDGYTEYLTQIWKHQDLIEASLNINDLSTPR